MQPVEIPVLKPLREAIRREHKVAIAYGDEKGAATDRVIWPIALAFYEGKQTVAAWCELRSGFRHFRTDRIKSLEARTERYPKRRAVLIMYLWAGLIAFGGVLASLYAGAFTTYLLIVWVLVTVALTFVVPRLQRPSTRV